MPTGQYERREEHKASISKGVRKSWKHRSKSVIDRFMDKVCVKGENECWPWIGARHRTDGYGIFGMYDKATGKTKCVRAHRYSFLLFKNVRIPEVMQVNHTCDTPRCVNPNHLVLGTPWENTQDMIERGRVRLAGDGSIFKGDFVSDLKHLANRSRNSDS